MSASILVAYATKYGSTREVAEEIAATLRESGSEVDIRPAREAHQLAGYQAIVLGAPLIMFHWHKDARRFLSEHRQVLLERPIAVFALGPVHDPHDEQEWQNSRAQFDKELAEYPWLTPVAIELFGGKFDPEQLRFPLNKLAAAAPASDARDWPAIRRWARQLASQLQTVP